MRIYIIVVYRKSPREKSPRVVGQVPLDTWRMNIGYLGNDPWMLFLAIKHGVFTFFNRVFFVISLAVIQKTLIFVGVNQFCRTP